MNGNPNPDSRPVRAEATPARVGSFATTGLFVLVAAVVLYFTGALVAPILVALLLKLVLAAPVRGLRRAGMPASMASVIVVVTAMTALTYGVYKLSGEVTELLQTVPARVEQVAEKLDTWRGSVEQVDRTVESVSQLGDEDALKVRVDRGGALGEVLDTTWQAVGAVLIVSFLLFFLLTHDDEFLRRLVEMLPSMEDKRIAVRSVREIERRISTYLVTVSCINACLGLAVGFAMKVLGLPNPAFWGVMAALLNFIPFAGALVGVALVGLVSVATFDSTLAMVVPPLIYLSLSAIEGNVITPIVVGRNLALNPTAVFLSVLLWGFMWGVIGIILAVPLLIALRVILEASERTEALGRFLAD